MATNFSNTEWASYDVSGNDLEAVISAIEGMPEAGRCEWLPHQSTSFDDAGVVTEATVDVGTRITLPTWTGESSARAAEQTEWRRFLSALEEHEQGHAALVVQQLTDLDQRMVGQSQADAERTFNEAVAALQTASDDYDHQTDHGRTTGTVITVPSD